MRSGASQPVSDADIGRSGKSLTGMIGDDFTMYLWDPTNHGTKPVSRLLGHQNKVNHVQFSPDGTTIASAGWDNHTKLWNARDGKFMKSLRGHVAPVSINQAFMLPPNLTPPHRSTNAPGARTAGSWSQEARTPPSKSGTCGQETWPWIFQATRTR